MSLMAKHFVGLQIKIAAIKVFLIKEMENRWRHLVAEAADLQGVPWLEVLQSLLGPCYKNFTDLYIVQWL